MPSTNERASRIGHSFVPKWWIVAFTVLLLVLAAALLYGLWAFWPLGLEIVPGDRSEERCTYFGLDFTVSTEGIYFVTVALAGALGGVVHTLRSFSMYVGTRQLRWSWVPFNLLLPLVGALGGTLFYLVFRAGLFSSSTSTSDASPFGFAAIAALVGLFSEQAVEKLRQIARQVFTEAPGTSPTTSTRRPDPRHPRTRRSDAAPGCADSPEPTSGSVPVRCVGSSLAVSAWR